MSIKITKINGFKLESQTDISRIYLDINEGDMLEGYSDQYNQTASDWLVVPASSVKQNSFNVVTPTNEPEISLVLQFKE